MNTLDAYLSEHGISNLRFANELSTEKRPCPENNVYRWRKGLVIPNLYWSERIKETTDGAVQPKDFLNGE